MNPDTSAPSPNQPAILVETPGPGIVPIRMIGALQQAIAQAIALPARVLLIRGTGRAFCAGADLKERRDMNEAARIAHNRAINDAIDALDAAPMPTIAVINGLALGGGCEMALACDLRIGAEDISIGLTEARIGAIPGAGGTQRLPRVVGASRALEMMFQGEPINGRRAEQIGLLNVAVPSERLDETALQMATLLATRSPSGAIHMKHLVYDGLEVTLEEGLKLERTTVRQVLASADYAEGLAAFAAKRPPVFGK